MTIVRGLAAAIALLGISTPAMAQTPAVSGAAWGARSPAVCAPLMTAAGPSAAQAAKLVQCSKDSASTSTGDLWLAEKVAVQLGAAKPFRDMYNVFTMPDADTTKQVIPITGSWMWSNCIETADAAKSGNAGKNCTETDVTKATGACWVTKAAGWKCNMNGTSSPSRRNMPPPK